MERTKIYEVEIVKLSMLLIAGILSFASITSAVADELDDQRKLVVMAIELKGYDCGSVLKVTERPEPVAYDVLCAAAKDGSGQQTLYFVQIAGGDIVVRPQ